LKPLLYFLFSVLFLFFSCNNKNDEKNSVITEKNDFLWHDNLKPGEIPDTQVKGYLNGKEVQFQYINFEKWHGSNDNVINFSTVKPAQQCGFINGFEGFVLINKSASINQGEWVKSKFTDNPNTFQAYYKSGDNKSTSAWNCALMIESISDKLVMGKIALYFNDEQKSRIAGKFEAVVCNN